MGIILLRCSNLLVNQRFIEFSLKVNFRFADKRAPLNSFIYTWNLKTIHCWPIRVNVKHVDFICSPISRFINQPTAG